MPTFTVTAPNGKTYDVTAPEGATAEQAIAYVQRKLASQKSGVSGEFQRGLESIKSSGRTALESLIGSPEEAAARGLERQAEMEQRYAEGPSLERVKRAYEQEGLLAAGKEALGQIPEAIAGQVPNIGATVAGARLGAMAGSLAGPVGTVVGGLAGAVAPSLLQQFGSNIERQAAEQQARGEALDISRGRAVAAAAPQAALDVAGQLIPLGRTLAGKILGKEIDALLSKGSKEAAEKLAEESLTKTLAKGTAVGAVAEIPTEVTQQMLERWQAGLPLTSDDALAEYGQTAYQVGLLAPIGGLGRVAERAAARGQIAEETAKKEAEEAAQAQAQKQAAEEAAARNRLALPAPEQTNYDKAFNAILSGAPPTVSSVRNATNLNPKDAREILSQLEKAGVVTAVDPKTGKRSVSQRFTTEDETAPQKSKLQRQREAAEKQELARLTKEEAAAAKAAEKARTKQEREAAQQEAARLKAERQRLSKQMSDQLWFSGDKPVPRPSDLAPTEAGETFDMFAARPAAPTTEAIPEPTVRPKKGKAPVATLTPEELPADIPADIPGLKAFAAALGFGRNLPPTLNAAKGKNVADPAVQKVLADLATKTRTVGASEKIAAYLDKHAPKEAPSAVPDTSVAEAQQAPAGAGVSVPVSEQKSEAGIPEETGGQRLADIGVRATEPVGREGVVAGALTEEAVPAAQKVAKPVVAPTPEDSRRAAIAKERSRLKADAIDAYDGNRISESTFNAIDKELKKPAADLEYVRELLSGKAVPRKRTEGGKGMRPDQDLRLKSKLKPRFFAPKYTGEAFDAETRSMVERGDLNGVLNAIAKRSNPAIRAVLRKIIALNLATKIRIGDPTGQFKYAPEANANLKKWFGGSEVVDERGEPLVVYTGTSKDTDFKAFKIPKNGAWFVADPAEASQYAVDNDSQNLKYDPDTRRYREVNTASRVMPVFLSIKNPATLSEADSNAMRYASNYRKVQGQIFDRLRAQGYDGVNMGNGVWVVIGSPTQIKSAIGNTGAFDPANPDIRYAEGSSGSYDPVTDTIVLDPDSGLNDHILVHEVIHAALVRALDNPNLKITKDFTKFFAQIKDQMGNAYGGQNLQEFAAELVSNPQFQALLKTIKAPRSESFWTKIMQTIADFFGFAPNAYESGLKFVSDALDVSSGVPVLPVDKMFYGPGNFEAVGEIGKAMPKLAGSAIEETKNIFSNLKEGGFAKMAFGLLRPDNINTLYGKTLTSIQPLLDAIEKRAGMQERRIKDANTKYVRFMKAEQKHPEAMKKLNDLAVDARLAEVDILDPKFVPNANNRAAYDKLKAIFNNLPADVQDVYRTVRKDYDAAFDEYKGLILKSVSPSLAKRLETQFTTRGKIVAYVPFLRRGDFWVEYTDPDTNERAAAAFESVRERQRFIDTQLRPKGIEFKPYKNLEAIRFDAAKIPPTSFIARIMTDLQEQGKAKGLSGEALRSQMDAVYQAYLTLMPGESILKQFMKSKNVSGMEKDLVRGYGDIMVRWARKMANSEYGPQIDKALDEILVQGQNSGNSTILAAAENIVDQRDFLHSPTYNKFTQTATTLSYFEYIAGNISSALVNLTSLPLLAWPILIRFGFGNATNAMMAAGRTAMNDWSKGKYAKLHQALDDHGQLQHTMAREVLEGRRQTTSDYTGAKAKVLDFLSIPFAATERYNRAVTAIAAYDLAIGKGQTEAEAIRYAITTTKDVHTSGMAATAPRWMQGPLGRVAFTFKSFAWNSAFITARAFHQATKGEKPEIRAEARKQLLGMYGMAMVLAGVKGMPFYGMVTTLGTMLQAMLGDDDEPFDIHEELRDFFGELQYKGFLNYALNLEISNRAGIATDLVFRDDPRGIQEHGYALSAMQQAFGPMASYAVNAERGIKQMNEGHVVRGVEALLPSWARNGFKGFRYMTEGALTLRGDPVDADVSAWNTLMQGIGFSPADLSSRYETISAAKGYEREVKTKQTRILQAFDIAITTGDQELMADVRNRIARFNQAFPEKAITPDTLRRSIMGRKAADKEMIYGVRFDKKLRPRIEKEFFEDEELEEE